MNVKRGLMTLILEESLVLEEIVVKGYERIVKVSDKKSGLQAIICIHNTSLGPALGGTRIYPYPTFEAALNDAMRLAKGMTYKSALAQTGLGGGKSVIIANPTQKSRELLLAFGHAVNHLEGQYICAEDVGCTPEDLKFVLQATPYVVGLVHEKSSGNPAPYTAWGTYRGIQSVMQKLFGTPSVFDRTIAIQGLGSVGSRLAELLFWEGAKLILSDVDLEKTERLAKIYGATTVAPSEILKVECDVLAPCALGGIINPETIPSLRCKAIAGCANNQLLKDSDADSLLKRGILYAPDFIINAGGLINVTEEFAESGYSPTAARTKTHNLYDELMKIYEMATNNKISTHAAALSLADYRIKYGVGKREARVQINHAR